MDLEARRKELGLRQTDVARMVGVSIQAYRWWALGVSNPTPENQKRLEEVLGLECARADSGNHPLK